MKRESATNVRTQLLEPRGEMTPFRYVGEGEPIIFCNHSHRREAEGRAWSFHRLAKRTVFAI